MNPENLPEYIPLEMWIDTLIQEKGCKISWKIINTQQIKNDTSWLDCYWKFEITITNWITIVWNDQYWECVGTETVFPIYDWKIGSYYPKKWEIAYAIIQKSTPEIMVYGKDSYESNQEIPICNVKELQVYQEAYSQNYILYWIIFIVWFMTLVFILIKKVKEKKN